MARAQDQVNSFTVTEAASTLQNRYEYNGDQTVLYAGYAARGYSADDNVWTIQKFTYVASQVTLKQTAFDSWTNRAGATYA